MKQIFPRRRLLFIILAFSAGIGICPGELCAQVRSVEEFNKLKPQWNDLASKKQQITIEGRVGSISRTVLRLLKCDLSFAPEPGKKLPKINRQTKTIEVYGRLGNKNGRLIFLVRSIRERATDMESLRIRKLAIGQDRIEDWYRLADWAKQRGTFYEDQELLNAYTDAYQRGLLLEYSNLSKDDAQGRLDLAARGKQYGMAEKLRAEYVHEAYRILWKSARTKKQPDYKNLLKKMLQDLPGSELPLKDPQLERQQQYQRNPLSAYREASPGTRRLLHRILYSEIMLKTIEENARQDGSNGKAIAEEIEKELPERKTLATKYRERELAYRFSRVELLGRSDLLKLFHLFSDRNEPEKAVQTLTRWLTARETAMRQEGPSGLIRVAEDYINLMNDKPKAVKLLREAHQQSPESEEILERLRRLGYVFKNGKWLTVEEAAKIPEDPIDKAIREGRVIIGMTSVQARSAMGGKPTTTTRFATAGDIYELWAYGERGTTRLVIHLQKKSGLNGSETRVTSIAQSAARK